MNFSIFRPYVAGNPYRQASAVAIGNFDGVHPGHRTIIARTQGSGLVPAVLTFEPHPSRLFRPDAPAARITLPAEKLRLLRKAGIKTVFLERFDTAFSQCPAEDFVRGYLIGRLHARHIVVGEDFVFGHKRGGNVALLKQLCEAAEVRVEIVPPLLAPDGEPYSSTRIRKAIAAGDMEKANLLLGRPFSVTARIRKGQQLGAELGFPTMNLHLSEAIVKPAYGVYAGWVNGTLPAAISYGVRPSVTADPTPVFEVHVLSGNAPTYGERITVSMTHWLRTEEKFPSLDTLTDQIAKDCAKARSILEKHPS